jgi:ribosomal protein L2
MTVMGTPIRNVLSAVKPRELADLYRSAQDEGCTLTRNSKHIQVQLPSGAKVFGPLTSSDRRCYLNIRSQLRRAGLDL